jgi:hypothetical protein
MWFAAYFSERTYIAVHHIAHGLKELVARQAKPACDLCSRVDDLTGGLALAIDNRFWSLRNLLILLWLLHLVLAMLNLIGAVGSSVGRRLLNL